MDYSVEIVTDFYNTASFCAVANSVKLNLLQWPIAYNQIPLWPIAHNQITQWPIAHNLVTTVAHSVEKPLKSNISVNSNLYSKLL
jgi:hypothetical protein